MSHVILYDFIKGMNFSRNSFYTIFFILRRIHAYKFYMYVSHNI